MPDIQIFLQPCDQVEWDGHNFFFYPDEMDGRAFVVHGADGHNPYIILPDPEEEDYYAGGELKGDIEREGGND